MSDLKRKAYLTRCILSAMVVGAVWYSDATPAFAEDLDNYLLDEIVITAARTETKAVDTPANITVVDAAKIENRRYQDVSEVLEDVPGAHIMDAGYGTSEKKISLNGDERVLILVDGRRVNFDMGTMTRSGYDLNQLPDIGLIERVEVLKGAGGALYGSDAVGGVINIITKKADGEFGKVSLGMGSFGTKDMSALYSAKNGKTGFTFSLSQIRQDYFKYKDARSDTTKRWPVPSDYQNDKASFKIEHELTDTTNLTVGYDYSKFEGMSPGNFAWGMPAYAYSIEKRTDNLYAKYDWLMKDADEGYVQFYHNELEYLYAGTMKEKTNGIDAQQAFSLSDNNKMVVGASWRQSDVETTGGTQYDEGIRNIAFFVNDTWEFVPTWTLNAGIRYDNHSEAGSETTMSAGINKRIDENSHAYFNWGQVFRAPTTDDLFYWSEGEDPYYGKYLSTGDRNLVAETGDTWTIGYSTKLNERTALDVNYFRSDLKDAINWSYGMTPEYPGGYSYVANVDEQKKRGMELSVTHELNDNVDLEASYTYIRVKNNSNNTGFVRDYNYLPNVYRLGVHYHDGKWDTSAFLRAGSGGSKVKYLDSSYVTMDMAISYKASDDVTIFAKGYNLTNEAYAEMGGYNYEGVYNYPAQSRFFILGAEYKF